MKKLFISTLKHITKFYIDNGIPLIEIRYRGQIIIGTAFNQSLVRIIREIGFENDILDVSDNDIYNLILDLLKISQDSDHSCKNVATHNKGVESERE